MARVDEIEFEILEDGRIRSTTSAISSANHSNAEAFFKYLAQLCGTDPVKTKRAHGHVHAHTHDHDHVHQ